MDSLSVTQKRGQDGDGVKSSHPPLATTQKPPLDSPDGFPHIIAEWPKGRDMLRIMFSKYNGRVNVDVRAWYESSEGELKPGKSGISIPVAQLPQLHDAIDEAMIIAKAAGWLEGGDS